MLKKDKIEYIHGINAERTSPNMKYRNPHKIANVAISNEDNNNIFFCNFISCVSVSFSEKFNILLIKFIC